MRAARIQKQKERTAQDDYWFYYYREMYETPPTANNEWSYYLHVYATDRDAAALLDINIPPVLVLRANRCLKEKDNQKALSYLKQAAKMHYYPAADRLMTLYSDLFVREYYGVSFNGGEALKYAHNKRSSGLAFGNVLTHNYLNDYDMYHLGRYIYFYIDENEIIETCFNHIAMTLEHKKRAQKALDYYCDCVDSQQQGIWTFLCWWWKEWRGLKGIGSMIAKLVWEDREENLIYSIS